MPLPLDELVFRFKLLRKMRDMREYCTVEPNPENTYSEGYIAALKELTEWLIETHEENSNESIQLSAMQQPLPR